jgi:coiled-coil domain-containing protein 174
MAPTNKAQAAGVSSGSFLELRAQVAKQKETLSKGNATAVVGGKKNVGKVRVYINSSFDFCLIMTIFLASQKPSKWALPNKGIEGRAARDMEQERLDRRTVESTRATLERKAKIYEKLKKGQSGGLSEAQFDGLLVDVRFP